MNPLPSDAHRLCVAPMMEWTDRHCRSLHRLLSPHARLYTEMVTTNALLHGPRQRLLAWGRAGHPVALQLGGADADDLAACARLGEAAGYDEINLNLGCPSDRVQEARIGACLMKEPELVADCVRAMVDAVTVPITVKCRLGVDDHDSYEFLQTLVAAAADAGACACIVHARKAFLSGLTPAQNRSIPPLDHARVYRLKDDFPELRIVLNGGLSDIGPIVAHARVLDGVMIGRAAYHDPWLIARSEAALFGTPLPGTPLDVLSAFGPYLERHLEAGGRLHDVTRHLLGLFNGCPGSRRFRQHLSEHAHRTGAGISVLEEAIAYVAPAYLQTKEAIGSCSNV